jgi:hypothetical protein
MRTHPLTFTVVLGAALIPATVAAQVGPTAAPARGTAQRTAILDALRPSIEAELRGPVEFRINCLQVHNGWALVNAEPQRPGGRPINPNTLPDPEFRDGLTVTAVMSYRDGRWNLVQRAIGATDVWYEQLAPRPLQHSRCY